MSLFGAGPTSVPPVAQRMLSQMQPFLSHPAFSGYAAMFQAPLSRMAEHHEAMSQHIDGGMQHLGVSATHRTRDMLLFDHAQDSWGRVKLAKVASNFTVNTVADRTEQIVGAAKGFGDGLARKIVPSTVDRLNPMNALSVMQHPDMAARYLSQKKDWLMQPYHLYQDPKQFLSKKMGEIKTGVLNFNEHRSGLDSGWKNAITHGGRVVVDQTQEKLAPLIGVGAVTALAFQFPIPRANTAAAKAKLFPEQSLLGKMASRRIPSFLLFTPIARMVGNPRLALAMAAYGGVMSVGKAISDSLELQQKSPEMHKRMTADGTEMRKSGFHLSVMTSRQTTSRAANDAKK
jgi:hypothetical protein